MLNLNNSVFPAKWDKIFSQSAEAQGESGYTDHFSKESVVVLMSRTKVRKWHVLARFTIKLNC